MKRRFVVLIFLIGMLGLPAPSVVSAEEDNRVVTLQSRVEQGAKIWSPLKVFMKKGETVTLRLENKTEVVHGFSIDEFKIKEQIFGGQSAEVTFEAEKKGVFRYYCFIHKAHQGGELIIE
ncbi:MAG TPA: cupredoxin domain-containing protein [Nitrospiria bacterium]